MERNRGVKTNVLETVPGQTPADPDKLLNHHLAVLKEYAKWSLLRAYPLPPASEARKTELLRETFKLGERLKMTKRDTVWLLYRGLFAESA